MGFFVRTNSPPDRSLSLLALSFLDTCLTQTNPHHRRSSFTSYFLFFWRPFSSKLLFLQSNVKPVETCCQKLFFFVFHSSFFFDHREICSLAGKYLRLFGWLY
ncbi:hypothetical protein L2E82_50880 [Cichorium intybus]|nr:hypothetical protein L2E82_50880 [Cichorium intybus]